MEQNNNPMSNQGQPNNDQGKTIAIISYITLIGFIIALVMHSSNKTSIGRFHLRQMMGLIFTIIAFYIVYFLAIAALGFLGLIVGVLGLGLLAFWIMGLISAVNGEEKPLPLVGEFYQKTMTFIN